ncbi:MAG: hypothetical protein K2K20_07775 [Lachnospiraceae bacterium]|nr:hypothetical protein [Lachnospiraceae bacterium]
MNEGLKRHIQYISLYQSKIFSIIILGGLIYGIFLTTIINDSPEKIIGYLETILAIIPCSMIVNYIRYQIDFCLSMGCTRRNIYLSIYILTAELLVESLAVFLLMKMIASTPITTDMILSFVISELLSATLGVLNGFLIRRFGYAKMVLILVIFYGGLAVFALNSFFLITEFLSSPSSWLLIIGGILILYGLIVTLFGKKAIDRM